MIDRKKIHYSKFESRMICGVSRNVVRFWTNDKKTVTCRKCKAAIKLGLNKNN
jgi:predicted nucleic acid-binding Zn ribbon protein